MPFSEGVFRAIYCSHVLEHLPAEDVPALLDEFHRLLRPEGLVRIVVPDLEAATARAIAGDSPWISIEAHLGTIPPELTHSRIRAALEGLFGFPSIHRTLVLREALPGGVGDRWEIRTGLRFMESEIEPDLLKHVEREDRCRDAIVFELRRRP